MKTLKKYKGILIAVVILIVGVLILLGLVSLIKGKFKNTKDPGISTSFFIQNKDNKYAMFNDDGKQLTEFIYDSVEEMFNGVVKVKDQDGKQSILNEKGKYLVKPGKYESILQNGGLFKVTEKENTYSLLNSKGKKIIKSANFDVKSNSYIYDVTIVLLNGKYIVYNYNGKKIYTFKAKDNTNENEEIAPSSSSYLDYASVYYDGLTVIFNVKTGKILAKIKDSEQYCINGVTDDGSIMTLNTCVTWYEVAENVKFKMIIDGKVKDKDGECDQLNLNGDNIVCTKNDVSYLLDKKLSPVSVDISTMSYKNYKEYATKVGDDVQILKNNKMIKKIENATLSDKGYTETGLYLIYKDKEYTFYNVDGKEMFNKKFKKAISFDTNGLARVSEDGENYYFINTKGKKVSDYFDTSYQTKDFYIITKDNEKGVMDKNGKIIVDVIYDNAEVLGYNDDFYAFLIKDDKNILIDLQTKKEVLSLDTTPAFYDNYIRYENNDKIIYYTYSGKKLYEE